MKIILSTIVFFWFVTNVSAQKHSVIGAWYWGNSNREISIFFKKDNSIEISSRKKGDAIVNKNLKTGRYSLSKNVITITWKDDTIENHKLNFTDKDSFVIHDLGTKGKFIFNRVVDEEVIVKPL